MKKLLFAALAALTLLALVGCAAEPAEPESAEYYLTDAGWRFDAFCTGAAAELRCPDAVFDGITEDDFYGKTYGSGA